MLTLEINDRRLSDRIAPSPPSRNRVTQDPETRSPDEPEVLCRFDPSPKTWNKML
jgi:hypothetical protein